jgi:fido (protein-threonine AMPylation protein)
MELSRLNSTICGLKNEADPWRDGPVTLTLPSGKTETLSLIADPKVKARDALHKAAEISSQGQALDAALAVYVDLVLAHCFKEGNRRTAVVAAHYFLRKHGIPISAEAIHQAGAGDLRDPIEVNRLRQKLDSLLIKS